MYFAPRNNWGPVHASRTPGLLLARLRLSLQIVRLQRSRFASPTLFRLPGRRQLLSLRLGTWDDGVTDVRPDQVLKVPLL